MSSPFDIFRRHQRIAMVIITGMAMISFVAFGLVDSFRQVPPVLMGVFLAAVFGCAMWVAGLTNEKSTEWGMMGAVLGALLGVLIAVRTRETPAAQMVGGNLSRQQYDELLMQRSIASRFMDMALMETKQGRFPGFRSMPGMNVDGQRDIIFCELLNREADRLQVAVADEGVIQFIKDQTKDKLQKDQFEKIRKELRVSDKEIIDALRRELRAGQTFSLLYGNIGGIISPAQRFEYFKRMTVKQTAEIVAVPVKEFEEGLPKPSTGELQELFDMYRVNFPNMDPQGRPDEGRPGFRQPTRVRTAYLEATLDEMKALVAEPTEEEIRERFEQQYKKDFPAGDMPGDGPGLPLLPGADENLPPGEPVPPPPAQPEQGTTPTTDEGAPAAEKPAAEAPPTEQPAPAEAAPATEPEGTEPATPEPAPEAGDNQSALPGRSDLQKVVFLQEPAGDDQPAAEAAPADAPATTDAAPADAPAADPAPATDPAPAVDPANPNVIPPDAVPAGDDPAPPAPSTAGRELDEALKSAIRDDLMRERAFPKMQEVIAAAKEYVSDQIFNHTAKEPGSEGYLSAEQLADNIRKYAAGNHLVYVETPWLSYQELTESEDYPLGRAFSFEMQFAAAAQLLFQTGAEDVYRPMEAQDFRSSSQFVFWKLDHKRDGVPERLDDELVQPQVIAAWKRRQAMPKAEARAAEIAKMLRESTEPAAKLLAEETVTGTKDSLYLTVKPTGAFSWYQRSTTAPRDLNNPPPVRVSQVPGAEEAGDRFMRAVCEEMQVGEVRLVPSFDDSVIYVVKLLSRVPDPATAEGNEQLRQQFIASGNLPEYMQLGYEDLQKHETLYDKWTEDLWARYDVRLPTSSLTEEELADTY
jgi:hypothetical protein